MSKYLMAGVLTTVVGVLALASAAVASPPEVGRCIYTRSGHYRTSNCTGARFSEGEYEWLPGAHNNRFTLEFSSGSKPPEFQTWLGPNGGYITPICRSLSGSGEYTTPNTVSLAVTFKECQYEAGPEQCQTPGLHEEEIATEPLEGHLAFGVKNRYVYINLSPAIPRTSYLSFGCTEEGHPRLSFELVPRTATGGLLLALAVRDVMIPANVVSASMKRRRLEMAHTYPGKQNVPTAYEGPEGPAAAGVNTGRIGGPYVEKGGVEAVAIQKDEEPLEISTQR
jgi:hypothetical protein